MQSLETDTPDRIRQAAAERVAAAERQLRRSRYALVAVSLILGILLGFGAGLLATDHWSGGREVIFIPIDGTEI